MNLLHALLLMNMRDRYSFHFKYMRVGDNEIICRKKKKRSDMSLTIGRAFESWAHIKFSDLIYFHSFIMIN